MIYEKLHYIWHIALPWNKSTLKAKVGKNFCKFLKNESGILEQYRILYYSKKNITLMHRNKGESDSLNIHRG